MVAEYVAKITGDTSNLEKAINKAKGSMKRLAEDEVLIKLNYDGNVKDFNQEFEKILKQCPELTIQFQYNVNKKMLDKELDKLHQLEKLKIDVETNNASKRISEMVSDLESAVKKDASEDIIASKIKGIYKYANTIGELGGKITTNLEESIYDAITGTKYEKVFDKIIDNIDTDKLKLFNFKGSLDDEISKSKSTIKDFETYIENLESKGASKNGLSSEFENLQDEIKILRSDISDMKQELDTLSGEQFLEMADDIAAVNTQLQEALDKIATLSGENGLGNVVKKWQDQDITKTNERYTAFNSKTMQTSGVHAAAGATGVSEKLIRSAIEEMGGEADSFIHSHPEKYAAFSDNDLEAFFTLFQEGIVRQIITSTDQALSLDMSKVNLDYKDEIMDYIRKRYDEIIESDIYETNISKYFDSLQTDLKTAFDNDVAKKLPSEVIEKFRSNYSDFLDTIGDSFTGNDLYDGVTYVIKQTLRESDSYKSASDELKSNIEKGLVHLTPYLFKTVNDYFDNATQIGFQEELMKVFSDPKYLKEGVESAIKLQDVSDFIKDAEIAGEKIGSGLVAGVRSGIDAHSDSREGIAIADDLVNGIVHEIDNRIPDIEAAGERLGEALTSAVDGVVNGEEIQTLTEIDKISSPTQEFDNVLQQDIVYLENYKNTIEEINQLKLQPQTDETEKKMQELQKLADYFFGNISITKNQWGNDGGNFANDPYGSERRHYKIKGYDDYVDEIWDIGRNKSKLNIGVLTSEFEGIDDEITRIENKSESLRQHFAKDLSDSRNYVKNLKSDFQDFVEFTNDLKTETSPSYIEAYNSDIKNMLERFPILEQFRDQFTTEEAREFVKTDAWDDFLATLPQAHEYLVSIGYDFERVNNSSVDNFKVTDNIDNQVNAMRELESENESLQQQARATASAEQELMDAVDYWSHSDTSGIDNQTESMQKLEAENESLRQSLQASADEMNHLNEEYGALQYDLESEQNFSQDIYSDLMTERKLTEELKAQNEELKERNKALGAGQQPNTGVTSEFKDEQQVVVGVANNEVGALSALRDAVNLVIDAVNEKTAAFEKEGAIVDQVIMNEELTALDVLSGYLVGLKRDIDAVTDSFKGIKLDVDMTNTDTNAVDKFVKSLSKLNEEKIDNNLIKVFVRLDDFAQAVNKIKIDDSSILASINNLLNKSKDLENLANALKENKKKIKEAVEEAEGKPKNYKEKYNSTLDDAITSTIRDIDYLEKKGKNTDAYFVKYKDYLEQLHDLSEKKLDFVSEDDYKQLMDLLDAIKAVRKEASLAINKETNAKSVQKYLGQVNDILSKNNNRKFKKTDEYKDLVELQGLLKSFDTSRPQSELDELGQKVLEVIARVKGLDESLKGGGFLSAFNHRLADMNAKFFAQYFSFQDIIRYAREAFNVIEDLNAQMVELAKVSEQSLKKIEDDFNSYASVAKDLGATISDTISATADWARMGYNVPDSQELARVALLYKNVGDGIDITSANQSLISTLQGYQMQADQAEHIVDVFNEVANNYAIDTAGIGEALQRSAASLNAANTSLEESVALVTAANTVVQNPESVGTTFKTLSARIRGAKTELSDLGEEEDEFTETTSKLRDLIKGLTGFDILEADEQTFKSIYDILVGIGKEWKNLSDIEQASLGEALAGKRNANTLYAILDNIDTLTNAYETAENAAGSAQREQENYEKGIEYSVNRAKAALQELAFDAINSDFLKGLIDFGTNAINLLDTIIDKFGLLKTAIIAIGTVWGTKNLG